MTFKEYANTRFFRIHIHLLIWSAFIILPPLLFELPTHNVLFVTFNLSMMILFFYTNTLVAIPLLLSKRRFFIYFLFIIFSLFLAFFISWLVSEKIFPNLAIYQKIENSIDLESKTNLRMEHAKIPYPFRTTASVFLILAISTSIKTTQEWLRNEKQNKEIENEKLNAELSFLKSQVNPHFLFNSLNSIYSLANKKSEKTADAVVRLSNLIRYMIYDTDKKLVDLENEIEYINNYLNLQQLRYNNRLLVKFNKPENTINMMIAPMLLIPFVENAFKHGVDNADKAYIQLDLELDDNMLSFKTKNTISSKNENQDTGSGIGLKNVRTRLNLLYPRKHELEIRTEDDIFFVNLKIQLV